MELHYKVRVKGKVISFSRAIELNYIEIIENGISIKDGVEFFRSTDLFDGDSKEIFENDILENENKRYLVEYYPGTFFIHNTIDEKGCIPMALSGLRCHNKITNLTIRD